MILANDDRTEDYLISVYNVNLSEGYKWKKVFKDSQTAVLKLFDDHTYILLLEGLRFFKLSTNGDIIFQEIVEK
ncbi:MAG: hypothetical protein N2746_11875 [Deltaproteobacteria bacterium]|nr:hypothetical protein [Deltaproteobacteria bacterium]